VAQLSSLGAHIFLFGPSRVENGAQFFYSWR
jgi:hypothetical protein